MQKIGRVRGGAILLQTWQRCVYSMLLVSRVLNSTSAYSYICGHSRTPKTWARRGIVAIRWNCAFSSMCIALKCKSRRLTGRKALKPKCLYVWSSRLTVDSSCNTGLDSRHTYSVLVSKMKSNHSFASSAAARTKLCWMKEFFVESLYYNEEQAKNYS